jgi:hypothetical protein
MYLQPVRWFLVIVVMGIGLSSCRTDFRLTADFKEIPVIYGLLDPSDSVNYVRIQRAYLDKDGSAFYWSQSADSIYYADVLDVTVEELSTGSIYLLERVNGDTIGLPKEPGTFAHLPNILYRLKAQLNPDDRYLLVVYNKQSHMTTTAATDLVDDFFSLLPSQGYVINWSGVAGEKVAFSWHSAANANIYELILSFNYLDVKPPAPDSVKTVRWSLFGNYYTTAAPGSGLEIVWSTSAFFKRIGSALPASPGGHREAMGVDFLLYAGGEVLGNYVNNQIASSGLTEIVVTPGYTNVDNGKGIFSSRLVKEFRNIPLGATALDSLADGQYTKHLGFSH